MNFKVWSEWDDLSAPPNVTLLNPSTTPVVGGDFTNIDFFVPVYEEGLPSLNLVHQMPNLKVLQLSTAGFENAIPFLKKGVQLCNGRGIHDESTAELALGLTISSLRNFPEFTLNQLKANWIHTREQSVYGKKIGIIGYGSIGRTIERMFSAFKCEIFPFSKSGSNGALKISELETYIGILDVIILIVPLTEETRNLFDKRLLSKMKSGSLLVNVSRGAVVDTSALIAELESGRIKAAIDVTDPMPLPSTHKLWRTRGVFISPHVGGDTSAFEPRAKEFINSQLEKFAAGLPLDNVVAVGK